MATRSGELRELLIGAIEAVQSGKLEPSEAKAIAALAQQVNLSLQVEHNIREAGRSPGSMGSMSLGDETEVVEMVK